VFQLKLQGNENDSWLYDYDKYLMLA